MPPWLSEAFCTILPLIDGKLMPIHRLRAGVPLQISSLESSALVSLVLC